MKGIAGLSVFAYRVLLIVHVRPHAAPDATVRGIGRAFDAACKELKDTGQPDVVHEVMIKRIIAAARKGERNVTRLRDAALTGLTKPRNEIRG